MLPFLKNRNDSPSMPVELKESDEGFDLLDAIAEDLLEAIKKGDKAVLKDALSALIDHIRDEDQVQDEEMGE